jgi:hypothetical protein
MAASAPLVLGVMTFYQRLGCRSFGIRMESDIERGRERDYLIVRLCLLGKCQSKYSERYALSLWREV